MSGNYPDGMVEAQKGPSMFTCKNKDCRHNFTVTGVYDLGQFTPNDDDDTTCPVCGSEGE